MIAEIRKVLSEKPTSNGWWRLVELIERAEGDERELASSYVMEHLKRTKAWKMASVPCGAWMEDSIGWSLSSVSTDFVVSLKDAQIIWCPPGSFLMGSPKKEKGRYVYEEQHPVKLEQGFWIGETSVIQRHFRSLIGHDFSRFMSIGGDLPVENVSWDKAAIFCNKLSQLEGLEEVFEDEHEGLSPTAQIKSKYQGENYYKAEGYRLPTEAEWEYACRAGTQTASYTGDLSLSDGLAKEIEPIAWYAGNSTNRTQPVKGKKPNAWELYDMLGNVYEWTYDIFYKNYDEFSESNPIRSVEGSGSRFGHNTTGRSVRVFRGGAFAYDGRACRSAFRTGAVPSMKANSSGFRFVRSGSFGG